MQNKLMKSINRKDLVMRAQGRVLTFLLAMLLIALSGCLSQPKPISVDKPLSSDEGGTDDENEETGDDFSYLSAINFMQVGSTQSTTTIRLYQDYEDSVLLRGKKINELLSLEPKPIRTQFCFIA